MNLFLEKIAASNKSFREEEYNNAMLRAKATAGASAAALVGSEMVMPGISKYHSYKSNSLGNSAETLTKRIHRSNMRQEDLMSDHMPRYRKLVEDGSPEALDTLNKIGRRRMELVDKVKKLKTGMAEEVISKRLHAKEHAVKASRAILHRPFARLLGGAMAANSALSLGYAKIMNPKSKKSTDS